ncbi:efflux RND transporter periplasmic adaptor subunit [Pseudomonas sp. RSB 5.4]|uniref:RND family efflux transporter, MFP subunit n=1 Tax=Pseudomonas fluorescens R124 TaxID=743713 RepID=A0A7U9CLD3_PSEFL|nr:MULTISPECIES: efflux RND transporter periplasmic adaptor subunit [Pseudomonas]EJZ55951.1 RND family efflux transporter, MFP subunit [Pseudomonas fluorescens R124]MBK5340938.1 efflux RND transporter periplasmic adaptor subunit [Pseudomonas sp. TH49]RBC01801.1 efflux RND transporter periplasmic adaptor subunit [Pseudomonas sp. MWU12-2115]
MASPGLKTVVVLSLLTALTACGKKEAPAEYFPRVFVQVVKPADYAAAVTLTGDVQARVQTELSFRVGGKIIQRMVDVGDRVSAKQVLAKLDPKDLQTNVDSAQAQVVAEQARVKQSAAAFVRQQKLLPKGYTSQSEFDSAQAALRSSQSALSAAQAQLANAKDQLSYTSLIADAPGIITERQAEVGQVVQATAPIFKLARDGDRDAVFNVYESLLSERPADRSIVVSLLDNPNIKTTGTVREITPAVSAQSGTVQVKVTLDSLPQGMQLGSVVSATAKGTGKTAVELPWSALTKNISDPAVWMVDDKGQAQLHNVTVGRYLTGKVIISGGLNGGEKVIVAGGQLLHPGMKVEIAENTYKDLQPGAQP